MIHDNCCNSVTKAVPSAAHDMRVLIAFCCCKIACSLKHLWKSGWKVVCKTTPKKAGLERLHFERRDNSEIIQTASQRGPEIRVFLGCSVHNFAGRENHFPVHDRIAGESATSGVEGETTWSLSISL